MRGFWPSVLRRQQAPLEEAAPSVPSAPRILVATLVRDAADYLPRYFEALAGLDYPKSRIALAFLEGDSIDATVKVISKRLAGLRAVYAHATLFHHDAGLRIEGARWEPSVQFARRSTLAMLRNRLLQRALQDEDWVLWIDADVIAYPADSLRRLLEADKDIVTPNCVRAPGGPSFDLNAFQGTEPTLDAEQHYLVDGIVQPPQGVNRRYLHDMRGEGLVRLDAVGGTMLLVRADLHRNGLVFPPYSYRGYIETEGLAMMARDMKIECWGMPDLEIIHANR